MVTHRQMDGSQADTTDRHTQLHLHRSRPRLRPRPRPRPPLSPPPWPRAPPRRTPHRPRLRVRNHPARLLVFAIALALVFILIVGLVPRRRSPPPPRLRHCLRPRPMLRSTRRPTCAYSQLRRNFGLSCCKERTRHQKRDLGGADNALTCPELGHQLKLSAAVWIRFC